MNGVYLHLLVNHVPTYLILTSILLGTWAFFRRHAFGLRLHYLLSLLGYGFVLLAHKTGELAREHLAESRQLADVGRLVSLHEELSESFMPAMLVGLLVTALAAYGHWRPFPHSRKLFIPSVLLQSVLWIILAVISHAGGEIRHPAVRF
ncbi:MAG: hypothetical protein LW884_06080 [Bacteroidetes bacterium]|jgi:hypothetical protein|nr:hypothetical protein [Bacteroidota bacterium]